MLLRDGAWLKFASKAASSQVLWLCQGAQKFVTAMLEAVANTCKGKHKSLQFFDAFPSLEAISSLFKRTMENPWRSKELKQLLYVSCRVALSLGLQPSKDWLKIFYINMFNLHKINKSLKHLVSRRNSITNKLCNVAVAATRFFKATPTNGI